MEKILSNIVDAYWNTTIGDVRIFVYLTITVLALLILYKPLKLCYKIQKELEPIDWDGGMDSDDEIKETETSCSSGVPNIFSCIHDFSEIKSGGENSIVAITGRCSGINSSGKSSVAASTGNYSLANNNAQNSIVASTGEDTVANSCGQSSIVACTGSHSVANSCGQSSVAVNTGEHTVANSYGESSVAVNTGNSSISISTEEGSVAIVTGKESFARVKRKDSIALVSGIKSKGGGKLGSWIILTEREEGCGEVYPIKDIKVLKVDGTNIKADTWYRLVNGKITEDGSITEDESITEEDLEEWNTSIKND